MSRIFSRRLCLRTPNPKRRDWGLNIVQPCPSTWFDRAHHRLLSPGDSLWRTQELVVNWVPANDPTSPKPATQGKRAGVCARQKNGG
ncbi:MAG: hypothetical protein MUP16_03675 [Sedimentisphaerales bacterium]|nr:hypothetical protein [Sedimentisphaerales bacterium]